LSVGVFMRKWFSSRRGEKKAREKFKKVWSHVGHDYVVHREYVTRVSLVFPFLVFRVTWDKCRPRDECC